MYVINPEKPQGWWVNQNFIPLVEGYNRKIDWVRYVARKIPDINDITKVIRPDEFNKELNKSIVDRIIYEIVYYLDMVADQ